MNKAEEATLMQMRLACQVRWFNNAEREVMQKHIKALEEQIAKNAKEQRK